MGRYRGPREVCYLLRFYMTVLVKIWNPGLEQMVVGKGRREENQRFHSPGVRDDDIVERGITLAETGEPNSYYHCCRRGWR